MDRRKFADQCVLIVVDKISNSWIKQLTNFPIRLNLNFLSNLSLSRSVSIVGWYGKKDSNVNTVKSPTRVTSDYFVIILQSYSIYILYYMYIWIERTTCGLFYSHFIFQNELYGLIFTEVYQEDMVSQISNYVLHFCVV